MRKITKVRLVIATCLVLIGCILFVGVMTMLRWDFMKLSTVKYETNTYEISEEFNSISVNTDTADIVFALSNNEKCRVECHEEENAKHSVTVKDGTLTVGLIDERSISDYIGYIGLNFGSPKITVYLPKTEYTSLLIREDTGDIEITNDFKFENIDISVSTGDVNISDVTCEGDVSVSVTTGDVYLNNINCSNLISNGNTGDLYLKDVIATEKFYIKRSTGDVEFEHCDSAEIFIETDTGDVTGSLLTDKVFVTVTDTGSVDVPKTITGGRCDINTDTGDIIITIIQH